MDRKIIDEYESGGQKLAAAIDGLSPQDLRELPPKDAGIGLWSIQQIVIHLMDADLIGTARMKSIIAEDHPQILGYDESKFAAKLFYELQDVQQAVRMFDLNRRQFAKVLRKLPDLAFSRTAQHNERGEITLEQSVHSRIQHVTHHIKFIRLKREKLGKPMK
jgi:uncharacterized damage-inducible protein DinB